MKAQSGALKEAQSKAAIEAQEVEKLQAQADVKEHGEFHHQRALQEIAKKMEKAQRRLEEIQGLAATRQAEMREVQELLQAKLDYNARILAETVKLNETMEQSPENKANIKVLQELVALNESLKKQIAAFKETCKSDREEWLAKVELVKNQKPDDDGRGDLILETFQTDSAKLEKMREAVAAKARDLAIVRRKIDSVPSRRELQQYQRQFVEVFEQMALKYTETKKYFNTYNAAEAMRAALEHEVKLLNSIHDTYPQVRGKRDKTEQFLTSLREIVAGMEKRLENHKKVLDAEVTKRNAADERYLKLVEKERQYFDMSKELETESQKTEVLEAKLKKKAKK